MPRCHRRDRSQRIMASIELEIARNAEMAAKRIVASRAKPAEGGTPSAPDTRDPIEMARAASAALHAST